MERGPLALFGAILAVGVGPALWLGAQLGTVDLAPGQRPAPVDEQFPGVEMDFGGAGAGDVPADEPLTTYTYYSPLASEKSMEPSTVATTRPSRVVRPVPPSPPPSAGPSAAPSAGPSISDSPTPTTESSTSPSAGPGPSGSPSGSPEPSAGPTP